jgi:hypothetical protein
MFSGDAPMIVARGKRPPISIIRSAGRGQSNLKLRIQDRKIACIRPFGLHFYLNSNQFYPRVKATERINHRKTTNEKNDTWNGPLVRHSGISFGWRGNNLRQQRLLLQLLHQPLRGATVTITGATTTTTTRTPTEARCTTTGATTTTITPIPGKQMSRPRHRTGLMLA